MSQDVVDFTKEPQRTCDRCGDRVVCFECFRIAQGRRRARLLTETTHRFEPTHSLTTRDVEHRRRMLNYLATAN